MSKTSDSHSAELAGDGEKTGRVSRWAVLKKTSPSGKTLFVCTVCGRVSTAPDKNCRTLEDPGETWGCSGDQEE